MEVVQWVEACGGGSGSGRKSGKGKKVAANAARWVTVQRLGNPLAMQDDRYFVATTVLVVSSAMPMGICWWLGCSLVVVAVVGGGDDDVGCVKRNIAVFVLS